MSGVVSDSLVEIVLEMPNSILFKLYSKMAEFERKFDEYTEGREYIEKAYNINLLTLMLFEAVKNKRHIADDVVVKMAKGVLANVYNVFVEYSSHEWAENFTYNKLRQDIEVPDGLSSIEHDLLPAVRVLTYIMESSTVNVNEVCILGNIKDYEKFANIKDIVTLSDIELECIEQCISREGIEVPKLEVSHSLLLFDIYGNTDWSKMYRKVSMRRFMNGIKEDYYNGLLEEGVESDRDLRVRKILIKIFKVLEAEKKPGRL